MNKRNPAVALFLALVGTAAGCESTPVTPETDSSSFFRAEIQGAVAKSYDGSGQFSAGSDPRRPIAPTSFSLFSVGRGESGNETFLLFRPGAERPGVGRYTLGIKGADFQAHFSRTGNRGETLESYTAFEGELHITLSTPDRIEGTFRMKGFRTCLRDSAWLSVVGCVVATDVIPGAPTIEVAGSFAAVSTAVVLPAWR